MNYSSKNADHSVSGYSKYHTVLEKTVASLELNGGIVEASLVDLTSGKTIRRFLSPYFTALVWDELLSCNQLKDSYLLYNAVDFLLSSGNTKNGWCFFRDGKEYPPDVDDTAVIADLLHELAALKRTHNVVDLLNNNRAEDGSYYVWIARNGIRFKSTKDPIVDLNVARFMLKISQDDYNIPSSIQNTLDLFPDKCFSVYSKNATVCSWFVSRFDRENFPNPMISDILPRINKFIPYFYTQLNLTLFPGLLSSTASTYKLTVDQQLLSKIDDTNKSMFRHQKSAFGYSCHTLDLAAMCRAEIFNKMKLKEENFNREKYIPGSCSQSKLYRDLITQSGLEK